jgi:hypothetical protein
MNLELTTEEINLIGKALSEQPYKDVVALLANIQNQINLQQKKEKEE